MNSNLANEQRPTQATQDAPDRSYGLLTVITTIVGVVVGSGIYFRADDLFRFTNGNLPLGIIVLSLVRCVSSLAV